MTDYISLADVSKRYSHAKVPAVSGLSLSIKAGEAYGLLGANGAGKSTTIRMIMDFIRPTNGTIKLLGRDNDADVRRNVGYLPGDVVLPKEVTGRAFLMYLANINKSVDKDYFNGLAKRFDAQLDKKMGELSKGNRQKIGLLQAFMHQPKIMILDEPTSGLDPLMQEQFYQMVDEARTRGAAVLLSSHSFEEVERMCDRIGIIRTGKMVYEGSASKIIASRMPRWRVTLEKTKDAKELAGSKALKVIDSNGSSLTIEPAKSINAALAALSHYPIVSMTTSQHALEDEFLHFYEKESQS